MELLAFARGPALAFSVAVFALGLAWRLYGIFRHPLPADHSQPRRVDTVAGALRAVFAKMLVSEFLAEALRDGRLRLKPVSGSITFHDPCQVSRRGGATSAPREVLAALGAELREMPPSGDANWCCGGGGGVVTLHRADEHRYRAFRIKMRQVEASGAERLATSCANCRLTFDDGQAHYGWDRKVESLLELVAAHLAAPA